MTSTSANLHACAIASQPLISASVSCGTTNVSALILRLLLPLQRRDLLVVLTPMVEAMGAMFAPLSRSDLLLQPPSIDLCILLPHLVLTGVIGERCLIDHGDAVLHWADGLAHATPTARLPVGIIQVLRGHIEAGIRALKPTQGALDACIEIDHRPHRPRRVLLEVGVTLGLEAAFLAVKALTDRDGFHHDTFLHLPVLR